MSGIISAYHNGGTKTGKTGDVAKYHIPYISPFPAVIIIPIRYLAHCQIGDKIICQIIHKMLLLGLLEYKTRIIVVILHCNILKKQIFYQCLMAAVNVNRGKTASNDMAIAHRHIPNAVTEGLHPYFQGFFPATPENTAIHQQILNICFPAIVLVASFHSFHYNSVIKGAQKAVGNPNLFGMQISVPSVL